MDLGNVIVQGHLHRSSFMDHVSFLNESNPPSALTFPRPTSYCKFFVEGSWAQTRSRSRIPTLNRKLVSVISIVFAPMNPPQKIYSSWWDAEKSMRMVDCSR